MARSLLPPQAMLGFLFNRHSRLPRILEGFGWVLGLVNLCRERQHPDAATWLLVTVLTNALFIWGCDRIRWYHSPKNDHGIRVHFRKARVPTSYVLALTSLGYFFGLRYGLVLPALLCVLVITSVNLILIYFHWRDKDPLPINYFSSNQYLYEK